MGMIDRYKKIFKGSDVKEQETLISYIPKPNEDDYKRGYIFRYFAQKTIDENSPIIEISNNTYIRVRVNPYYRVSKLRWRISGSLKPTYDLKGILEDNSVSESNRISIKLASKSIVNLKLYLPNLLQFHK